jgi:hypothetical protein
VVGIHNIIRVVHNRDIVPHLPPKEVYTHCGVEIWYNDDSSSYVECDITESEKCSDQDYVYDISDHLHYLDLPISNMCRSAAA